MSVGLGVKLKVRQQRDPHVKAGLEPRVGVGRSSCLQTCWPTKERVAKAGLLLEQSNLQGSYFQTCL